MNIIKLEGTTPGAHCLFLAELNSEFSWSRWILNSLLYTYTDEFIFHVASKHTVWHLYFCDNTMICLRTPGLARK